MTKKETFSKPINILQAYLKCYCKNTKNQILTEKGKKYDKKITDNESLLGL